MNHPVVSRCFENALPIPCGASMLRYIDAVSRSSNTGSSGLHCVHQASPPVEPLTCGGGARLLCRIPSVVRLRLRSLLPRRLPVLSADAKYDTNHGTDYIADHLDHRRRVRRRSRRRLRHIADTGLCAIIVQFITCYFSLWVIFTNIQLTQKMSK